MKQQVNLYTAQVATSFWKEYFPLPQIGAGVIAILVLVYCFSLFRYWGLVDDLNRLEVRHQTVNSQLEQLNADIAAMKADPALEALVTRLEQETGAKTAMLQMISAENIGASGGFSRHLEGLARRSVEGLWLTKIDLLEGGRRLGLEGRSGKPELVPQLIRSLTGEPAFSGAQFDIFAMAQAETGKPLSFEVRAEAGEQE